MAVIAVGGVIAGLVFLVYRMERARGPDARMKMLNKELSGSPDAKPGNR